MITREDATYRSSFTQSSLNARISCERSHRSPKSPEHSTYFLLQFIHALKKSMPVSLRKRLSHRSSAGSLRRSDSKDRPAASRSTGATTVPSTETADLSTTPPPPLHLTLPQEPEQARTTPSRSLLERYKERSPLGKLPSTPSSTPGHDAKPQGRSAASLEDLGDDELSRLADSPTPMPRSRETQTIDGVEFTMVGSEQKDRRRRSTEPARSRSAASNHDGLGHRRATRSQTRRQERIDSVANAEEAKVEEKDLADDAAGKDEATIRPVTFRARGETEVSLSKIPAKRPTTPASSPAKRIEHEEVAPHTPDQDDTPTKRTSSPDPLAESPISPTSSPIETKRDWTAEDSVVVIPPIYDLTQLAGHQWLSPLSSTSRAADPWGWCKRWTCCKCDGGTIVEQRRCSKLKCGHVRCGRHCRLVEWKDGKRPGRL